MSKAAQGFSPEAYYMYVEGGNPRRTPIIGKIAIYEWKLLSVRKPAVSTLDLVHNI
jgi:hypothetical protein